MIEANCVTTLCLIVYCLRCYLCSLSVQSQGEQIEIRNAENVVLFFETSDHSVVQAYWANRTSLL